MSIKDDKEFFLFMDMRAENQWASFKMTPKKWVLATQNYNSRLEALNSTRHCINVPKNPRALMETLGDVESKVASRILKNDFICESFQIANCDRPTYPSLVTAARSNTDHFWRKHCGAVPLVKTQESVVVNNSGKPVSTFPARFDASI
jgi:hypothetical protein